MCAVLNEHEQIFQKNNDKDLEKLIIKGFDRWMIEGRDIRAVYSDHVTRCEFYEMLKNINGNSKLDVMKVYPMIGDVWWSYLSKLIDN